MESNNTVISSDKLCTYSDFWYATMHVATYCTPKILRKLATKVISIFKRVTLQEDDLTSNHHALCIFAVDNLNFHWKYSAFSNIWGDKIAFIVYIATYFLIQISSQMLLQQWILSMSIKLHSYVCIILRYYKNLMYNYISVPTTHLIYVRSYRSWIRANHQICYSSLIA